MKKFIISSIAAMVVFAGAYASAATAEDMGTMTIKAGVPASYIMGLQKNLNVCANATPALVADGKYGAKTTAAVKAFQMSTPGLTVDGKAGNMTKAALAAKCSGSTTTTTTGSAALCPNGMTLASNCMTAPVASTLNGGAGNIQSMTLLGSPSNVQVGEGNSNVPVMAFEVRADAGSDLKLTNLRVSLNKTSGTGSTWASRYMTGVSVWQGSTMVGSANVADLSQDGTAYTGTIALNNVVVKANATTQLTVAVSANSSIDTGDASSVWTATASSLRYQDASGAILTSSTSVSQTLRFLKLSTSASVKLKVSEDANNPKDRTVVSNYTTTTNDVSLLKFSVKAEGSDMNIYKIALPATATGVTNATQISSYYKLKYNGAIISSMTVSAAGLTPTITFGDTTVAGSTSLNGGIGRITIAKDTTASFEVTADVNAICDGVSTTAPCTATASTEFSTGDTLKVEFPSATLQSSAVTVLDQTGSSLGTSSTNRTGSATGYAATFRIQGVSSTMSSTSSPVSTINSSGAVTSVQYTARLNVTATGNDFFIPRNAAFVAGAQSTTVPTVTSPTTGVSFAVVNGSGNYVDGTAAAGRLDSANNVSSSVNLVSGGIVDPSGRIKIAEGQTAVIDVTVTISDPATANVAGQYKVGILSVNGADTSTGTIAPFVTTPTVSYETTFNTPAFQ